MMQSLHPYPAPEALGHDVWLIDLLEQGHPYRTGAYLIAGEQPTLIDTGSYTSHEALLAGLAACSITPADLRYIIVTHVHLDHAGGAGQLMRLAKHADLIVHPKGAKHMVDPSRLWAGASAVYGEQLSALFGSALPIPADRIIVKNHLDTLAIGSRELTFFDSPGHAKHHFTILDPASDALFAGDALGIRYRTGFTGLDFEWVLPSTSPVDFDPVALRNTVAMLAAVPFSRVFHAHYGPSPKAEACREVLRYGDKLAAWTQEVGARETDVEVLTYQLKDWVVEQLRQDGHPIQGYPAALDVDMFLDAMGLKVYSDRVRSNG